jgi:hypothetical protein
MKSRNIFWGVVLVLIGTLFFLRNFDILYFSWRDIFHLWPLILVLIGIAILPIKTTIKLLLSAVAIIFTIVMINASPGYWHSDSWFRWDREMDRRIDRKSSTQQFNEPFNKTTETASLEFEAVAGSFKIGGTTSDLFDFEREGNIGPYESELEVSGSKVKVKIGLEGSRIRSGNIRNKVKFSLNSNPVWDLDLDIGAAEVELDLRDYLVREVKIDGGAAAIKLILGDRSDNTNLRISTGASSVTIRIPENVACEIDTDTILSSKDLDGFNKVADGMYVSENFADCEKNVSIEIDSALSSLKVIRY